MNVSSRSSQGDVTPERSATDIVRMSKVRFVWPGAQAFGIDIDRLALPSGSRTLLVGASGSGKTTLLSLLCGIIVPQAGRITILDEDIAQLSHAARDRFRAEHIGVIFQMFNLLPYGSVIDNVVLPLSFASVRRQRVLQEGSETEAARRLLEALGIEGALLEGPAAALSVGQQQRVAAARALIGKPELIVADEPTSALDQGRQERFLDLLFAQLSETGTSLLMVSHDRGLAGRFDQVLDLTDILSREAAA